MAELRKCGRGDFITLTFSEEELAKLVKEVGDDAQAVCIKAVRRWLELNRFHKEGAIKHFIVPELGQVNTERVHMHGIIFGGSRERTRRILNRWKYGRVDMGNRCDASTCSYIVKYMAKVDVKRPLFKPRVLVSKGLGKCMAEELKGIVRFNEKNPELTVSTLTLGGNVVGIPRYIWRKLLNEKEREQICVARIREGKMRIRGKEYNMHIGEERLAYFRALDREREKDMLVRGTREFKARRESAKKRYKSKLYEECYFERNIYRENARNKAFLTNFAAAIKPKTKNFNYVDFKIKMAESRETYRCDGERNGMYGKRDPKYNETGEGWTKIAFKLKGETGFVLRKERTRAADRPVGGLPKRLSGRKRGNGGIAGNGQEVDMVGLFAEWNAETDRKRE